MAKPTEEAKKTIEAIHPYLLLQQLRPASPMSRQKGCTRNKLGKGGSL
jgi:hypothetical protein